MYFNFSFLNYSMTFVDKLPGQQLSSSNNLLIIHNHQDLFYFLICLGASSNLTSQIWSLDFYFNYKDCPFPIGSSLRRKKKNKQLQSHRNIYTKSEEKNKIQKNKILYFYKSTFQLLILVHLLLTVAASHLLILACESHVGH